MSPVAAGPILAAAAAPVVSTTDLALRAKPNADVPTLPAGFPAHLSHELAWTGSDFDHSSGHILVLNDIHHSEIATALESYKCQSPPPHQHLSSLYVLTVFIALDQDGDLVEPSNFPLPTLGPKLRELCRDVHDGKGFCIVRGINPEAYSVEDLTLAYLGIQSYIAEQRGRQDKCGNMLGW